MAKMDYREICDRCGKIINSCPPYVPYEVYIKGSRWAYVPVLNVNYARSIGHKVCCEACARSMVEKRNLLSVKTRDRRERELVASYRRIMA